jgi:Protein of unknown function (DUF3140)
MTRSTAPIRNSRARSASDEEVKQRFFALVNLTAPELEAWLETAQSKSVGFDAGDGESVGRKAGRRIVEILGKARLDADDMKLMRKTVGFIRRHRAQGPARHVETSRWRYALMNWGHDPLRATAADTPWRDA